MIEKTKAGKIKGISRKELRKKKKGENEHGTSKTPHL